MSVKINFFDSHYDLPENRVLDAHGERFDQGIMHMENANFCWSICQNFDENSEAKNTIK